VFDIFRGDLMAGDGVAFEASHQGSERDLAGFTRSLEFSESSGFPNLARVGFPEPLTKISRPPVIDKRARARVFYCFFLLRVIKFFFFGPRVVRFVVRFAVREWSRRRRICCNYKWL
jgi:hypothetical protein